MKIEKTGESVPLEIKRCYLPFVLTDFCPECGLETKKYLTVIVDFTMTEVP